MPDQPTTRAAFQLAWLQQHHPEVVGDPSLLSTEDRMALAMATTGWAVERIGLMEEGDDVRVVE